MAALRLSSSGLCCRNSNSKWASRSRVPLRQPIVLRSPSSGALRALAGDEQAFETAALRLQQLLDEAAWDTSDAVRAELSTYSPAMKLTFLTNIGSFLTLIAFGISWATGEDPLGGVRLTYESLDAALEGLVYAMPLLVCSLVSRTGGFRRAFPVVEDLHQAQISMLTPLLQGLSPTQQLIAASSTVLPMLLLLLPAMHGSAAALGDMAASEVIEPLVSVAGPLPPVTLTASAAVTSAGAAAGAAGTSAAAAASGAAAATAAAAAVSSGLPAVVPALPATVDAAAAAAAASAAASSPLAGLSSGLSSLVASAAGAVSAGPWDYPAKLIVREAGTLAPAVLSGFLAAWLVVAQLAPKRSHVRAIQDALNSADRYFRLSVSQSASVSIDADAEGGGFGGSTAAASAATSEAFKQVAVLWLLSRRKVCQLAYMLTAMSVVYYAIVWQETHDLATPATAALCSVLLELWLCQHEAAQSRQRRSQGSRRT